MNKKTIIALVALSLSATSGVFASGLEISGEASVNFKREKAEGDRRTATVATVTINGEQKLDEFWTLFARLGAQHTNRAGMGDLSDDDDRSEIGLDQFGFNYTNRDMAYKIGRQSAGVGQLSLLYSRPDSNIGRHNFVDGVTMHGALRNLDLSAVIAREDNWKGDSDNRVYALRVGTSSGDKIHYGLTLGRYDYKDGGATNHWAVDGTFQLTDKHQLAAEFGRSNSHDDKNAYALMWTYDADDKTSLFITNFKVEANSDMGGQTDFANNGRGYHYGVSHQLSEDFGVEVVYKNEKDITTKEQAKTWETKFTYSF